MTPRPEWIIPKYIADIMQIQFIREKWEFKQLWGGR